MVGRRRDAATASAGQVGGLTFEGCVATSGAAVGCVNLPAGTDTDPTGVAVSPDGRSVYVAANDRVEHFFAASNGALTYDGCVSNDGSGGACADIPGTASTLPEANRRGSHSPVTSTAASMSALPGVLSLAHLSCSRSRRLADPSLGRAAALSGT